MVSVIGVLFLFLVFVFLFSTISIVKSQFVNFLFHTLTVVSIYAVIKTGFYSFYTIYLVGFIAWISSPVSSKLIHLDFSFSFRDWVVAFLIWLLFAVVYLDFSNFYILHPGESLDISIYSRLAYYNDIFGVENTRGIYNLFDQSPKIELYHHFELWMMNFGYFFDGASRSMNLLLFVFPAISFLCYLGIKETLNLKEYSSLAFLLIFFLVMWPYDLLVGIFDLGLPRGGSGTIILGTKNILVLPILLAVIFEIRQKSSNFYLTAVSLFLYPLLIPLISVSLITYIFFFSKNSVKKLWIHFGLIGLILAFMVVFPNSHPGFNLYGLFELPILPKIVFVSVLTPLISFGFYWILVVRKVGSTKFNDLFLFFSISLVFSIVFWLLFNKNIDSNQFFRNLFIPLCSFSIAFGIVAFYSKKAYAFAAIGLIVFVFPVVTIFGKSQLDHPTDELVSIVSKLKEDDRILFFPDPGVVNSVFMYNERMFLSRDVSHLNNFFDDIHLLSTVTLLNSKALERNGIAKEMIDYYKVISPLFRACGDSPILSQCVREFAAQYDFQKGLVHKNNPFASAFKTKISLGNYFLVDL